MHVQPPGAPHSTAFEVDRVLLPSDHAQQQQQLLEGEVQSLVDSLYQGINATLLAYGERACAC